MSLYTDSIAAFIYSSVILYIAVSALKICLVGLNMKFYAKLLQRQSPIGVKSSDSSWHVIF
jgi:hypothetical protein